MPSFVSHIELAQDVCDRMNYDADLVRYVRTYSLGGDLCRFSKCRRLSHRNKKEEFIFNMVSYIKDNKLTNDKEIMGILYGHISHYIMDDTMHPLIRLIDKKCIKVKMKSHTLIEGMIDSYIVKYKYDMEIDNYLNRKMLVVGIGSDSYKMINMVYKKTYDINYVGISYILSKFIYNKIYFLFRIIGKKSIRKIVGYDKFISMNSDIIDENMNNILSMYNKSIYFVIDEIKKVNRYLGL